MSSPNPSVTVPHPLRPGETLDECEQLGKRYLPDDPFPLVRVRAKGCETPFYVEESDIR